ncbi:MAG: MBL fold metallo-hydrolase [Thermodesulfovibrionales bacterium]
MTVKTVPAGPLETNCYIVVDDSTGKAMVVDPGDEPDRLLELLEGLQVSHIVMTHGHFDHVGAVAELREATGASLAMHGDEAETYASVRDQAVLWGFEVGDLPEPDLLLRDGDELRVGGLSFRVLHTPGHSPGGICLYGEGILISGDTVFAGSVGRTDFPGGSLEELRRSFRRLMELPPGTRVLPGHGPATTVERERAFNILSGELG